MAQAILPSSGYVSRSWHAFALFLLAAFISSCGGGGQQSSQPPPPPPPNPDFQIAAKPASVSLTAGGSTTSVLTVTPLNGFTAQVTVQLSGLPTGVTVSPANISLSPNTSQTISVLAAANAPATPSAATVIITGTSGTLTHETDLGVSVSAGGGKGGGTLSTRTRYVRTDAVTEYYLWLNSHWAVYDLPTSHFFVTDPFSNQIFVLDSVSETEIGVIAVPGAYGIDETPDHTTIYVGTLAGDVYSIDPVAMKVKNRYLATQIGPYGYQALIALVLSDGRLALLGEQGGIASVDGSSGIAIWNPTDNSITMYGAASLGGAPASPLCGAAFGLHIFGFGLTADRASIITGSGNGLCEMNAATGSYLLTTVNGNSGSIVASPDGKFLAFPSPPNGVVLYDPRTLSQVAQFPVNRGDSGFSTLSLIFSADSSTLFVAGDSIVYAYNVTTHAQTGWFPNMSVTDTSGGLAVGSIYGPNFTAVDGTGLLVGPLEEGFGFVDSAAMKTGAVGTGFLNNYLNPATGPVAGGTQTQWSVPSTVTSASSIFFGKNQAPAPSVTGSLITVTTPPGTAGAADVYVFANDGGMDLIPDGFSYGPTILEVTPDVATLDGDGTGIVYGYGFGSPDATTIPANLSVTVGGKSAAITGFIPNAYETAAPPYPLQSVYYTIPPGTAVGPADVSVTSSSGTSTATGGLTYSPAARQFPLAGAALVQGVYDSAQDVYYFTDATKIQAFSLAQGKWLPALTNLASKGAKRLWGISLSPDGSKLAVADAQASLIFLMDPSNPPSVKTFPFAPTELVQGLIVGPCGVAISDSGIVYITADVQGGTGYSNFFKLDTNSGILTDYHLTGPGGGASDANLRTVLSSDNSRAYFNDLGSIFSIDTATDTVLYAPYPLPCCTNSYDLALSRNQVQFMAAAYLYDSNLNQESFYVLNDREAASISYVFGAKFSPDGSLLFQPSVSGIDVFDGRLGTLRDRVALGFPLSTNYDALVEDGSDNVLVAIMGTGGNGVAIVDLSSLGEPTPLPYSGRASLSSRPRSGRSGNAGNSNAGVAPNSSQRTPTSRPRPIPYITWPNPLLIR
jgi:WD40 repeat protein